MNKLTLKSAIQTDYIPPDDWLIHEWEMLNDLGFEVDDAYSMSFEQLEDFLGKEKKVKFKVYRKKDGWYLEPTINNQKTKTEIFRYHTKLMHRIHDLFGKF